MADQEVHYEWAPITDLTNDDLDTAKNELPALMSVWWESRRELSESQVEDFNERLNREWAIETGIIERLYTLDEGTTRLLIEHGIDASLIGHDDNGSSPELVAGIIRDHQEAVEWLFEVVRQEQDLTTSFVKQLHQLMTRKQEYAEGVDSLGRPTRIKLRHGDYKQRPNNPTRPDGQIHQYCPPEHVAAEMDRLIKIHGEHMVLEVQPDLSAAWLHHRFLQVHPFQDGNGRVARALASLVLIRAGWFPLVVTRRDRPRYMSALQEADSGSLRRLIDLFGSIQKRAFRTGLSIVGDVQREDARLDQMLDAIGEAFSRREKEHQGEMEEAKWIAQDLQAIAQTELEDVRSGLRSRIGPDLQVFVDVGRDDSDQRGWYRYQVVDTAKRLDYFANMSNFHSWVRIAFVTAAGRSEILLSFHTVGREYRGVIGASMCFYRRQRTDGEGIEQQVIELQTVSDDLFQVGYKEPFESAEARFRPWLEEALVIGLDFWRRGE